MGAGAFRHGRDGLPEKVTLELSSDRIEKGTQVDTHVKSFSGLRKRQKQRSGAGDMPSVFYKD